jgi:hypothetical protein
LHGESFNLGALLALDRAALFNSQPSAALAGMDAGCVNVYVFALQKRKAKKWYGCHFLAAQGIERKYRKPRRG